MASPQLDNGFVQLAKELDAALLREPLTAREHAVIRCVIHLTYGAVGSPKQARIGPTLIADMTNSDKANTKKTIKKLRDRNILTYEMDGTRYPLIGIQKDYETWEGATPKGVKTTPQGVKLTPVEQGSKQPPSKGSKQPLCGGQNNPPLDTDTKIQEKVNQKEKPDLAVVFDYWREVMNHPRAKLDTERTTQIQRAFKLKFSIDDCRAAIDGCALTPHNMGQNDRNQRFDGLHVIFRNAEQIERFIGNAQNPPEATHANNSRSSSTPYERVRAATKQSLIDAYSRDSRQNLDTHGRNLRAWEA